MTLPGAGCDPRFPHMRCVVTGTGAHDATDRIVYNRSTGALLYDADGVGGTAAVRFATLAPKLVLTAADFLVV